LKNIDLEIQSGEFVCIIGDVGSGKTSLLSSIIGDMMYVSDNQVKELGGLEAHHSSEEYTKLHTKIIQSEVK
jgi:ABC-type lipoprotein export system ATPase subunit